MGKWETWRAGGLSGWQSQQSGACLSCSTTLRDQDDDFGDDEQYDDGGGDKTLEYDGS